MLKRVSIQNFKSLKDVTLDLQKINLLIGPNNSGKTNFLKALEYFSKCVEGARGFTFQDSYKREIKSTLHIRLIYSKPDRARSYDHVFTVLRPVEGEDETGDYYSVCASYDDNLEGDEPHAFFDEVLKDSFEKAHGLFKIYKIDSNKLDKPGPVGMGQEIVDADASNLVGFLDRMLGNKYRKTVFNRTETDLHTCVPEFDEINLDDIIPSNELKKQFGDKSFKRLGLTNSQQGITYWADELSEGTMYFLALLCIINQPNPPKLLLLEEPEKGIHPRRIREVMNFIRRLVVEKAIQVIMTTHSPLLLDEFAESPESVFVFDKDEDGATFVKNLQRDIIEPANEKNIELGIPPVHYTDALGEYWTIGFLGGIPHEAV